jgi:hypothetical protein
MPWFSGGGGGGGATLVTESAYYSGGQVAAGNRPPWSILDSGTDVLDRTNPLQPLARKDGLYIISAEVVVENATLAECDLIFDYAGVAAVIRGYGVSDSGIGFSALVSGSYVLTAGQAIRLTVTTDAGATTVELRNALVSRIGLA